MSVSASPAPPVNPRFLLLLAVLALFLAGMDQTVVSTALPRITAELGGLELYAWVFSAYMLTYTALGPLGGRLGDLYGRRVILLTGIAVLLLGSVLAGIARDMQLLVLSRAVQGVGAALVTSSAYALPGDLFPPSELGRYNGLMAVGYALASVAGPLVGGALTEHLSWRWAFYFNVPLCLGILALVWLRFPRGLRQAARARLDVAGAVLMTSSLTLGLLGITRIGELHTIQDGPTLLALGAGSVLFLLFLRVEQRAEAPIIPLHVFTLPVFALTMGLALIIGVAFYVFALYLPLFLQGVMGMAPTRAGLMMAPMLLSLIVGSAAGGALVTRLGRYKTLIVGSMFLGSVAMCWLALLTPSSGTPAVAGGMAALGLSMGLALPNLVLAAQNVTPHAYLGLATALSTFSRHLGGVVGVAVAGVLVSSRLEATLSGPAGAGLEGATSRALGEHGLDAQRLMGLLADRSNGAGATMPLPQDLLERLRELLAGVLGHTFLESAGIMLLASLLALGMRELPLRKKVEAELGEGP